MRQRQGLEISGGRRQGGVIQEAEKAGGRAVILHAVGQCLGGTISRAGMKISERRDARKAGQRAAQSGR